ncbi:MAG: hypothetical protein DMF49_08930 [Acidobacteria bacterium]|nr:MAG: hypothetical protein DMF49_08930 [Acidobacteriota bacterium]
MPAPVEPVNYKKLFRKLERTLSQIQRSEDTPATLEAIMRSLVDDFHEELGITAARLYQRRDSVYVLKTQYGAGHHVRPGLRIPASYRPVRTAMEHGYVFMGEDDPGFDHRLEQKLGVRYFAAIALGDKREYLLGFTVRGDAGAEQTRLSLNTVRHAVNLKLRQEVLESLIEQAKLIQLSLLPQRAPQFGDYDIAGSSVPAEEVGGDLYDFLPVSTRILGVAVGDSSGHGLPAALQARDVITGLRVAINEDYKIVRAVERLNQVISRGSPSARFISLFYGELETNGNLIYTNAGHPPPLVFRDGEIRRLRKGGLVLGPNPDAIYERGYLSFRHGTAMLLYTDGITEARSAGGIEFGMERLARLLRRHHSRPASDIVQEVFGAVERFSRGPFEDDRTVVVVRRPAAA